MCFHKFSVKYIYVLSAFQGELNHKKLEGETGREKPNAISP
ncbi:hypothetical protein HMPREF9176_0652 [Streptococcus downei F0415]|nr:hypothetical protein HMPREF9176_0652 [Streptococcus downei F0415]